jgi:hypothetical protein
MKTRQTRPDPIAKSQRKAIAARRLGTNLRCACGESRVETLVKDGNEIICAKCKRRKKGQTIVDQHHVAGRANSPITVAVPVNDHRALLSEAQRDWPKQTLENPDGCPLRAAAGCILGFVDTVVYLIDQLLRWIAEMLELLSDLLAKRLGPKWWANTPLDEFARKDTKRCRKSKRSQ